MATFLTDSNVKAVTSATHLGNSVTMHQCYCNPRELFYLPLDIILLCLSKKHHLHIVGPAGQKNIPCCAAEMKCNLEYEMTSYLEQHACSNDVSCVQDSILV